MHSTDDVCAWLKTSSLSCAPKTFTSSTHHGSSFAARDTEHFLTVSSTSPVLFSSTSPTPGLSSTHPLVHCEDPRQDGISAEYQPLTGCEPKRIELNRTLFNLSNQEIDDQDGIEEVSRAVFVLFLELHGSSGSWSDGGSWSSKSDKSSNSWKSYQVCESCNNWVYEHRAQNVNRTPTQTACTDAHSVSQHKLNSMITFHHANTRGSSAQLRIAHLLCP